MPCAPADVVLATNTSALSVTDIAEPRPPPSAVIGLHFFNPAPVMPLVEVVAAPLADPAVVDRAVALIVTAWGKVTVIQRGHARVHRQSGQSAVHARGARASLEAGGGDGRGRSTRRSATPASRWAHSSSWT